jgi:alkylation response protein AidB-like acyl-CoA dehydrogenase
LRLGQSDREIELRSEIREWLSNVLPEIWGSDSQPDQPSEAEEYAMRRRFDAVAFRDGWAGISWPEEYGGRGGSLLDQIIFSEECERAGAPEVFNRVGVGIIAHAIMMFGSEKQKQRHLPAILSGTEIWCQGFSEPDAGSDLASISTRAISDGDEWTIEGQKVWTTLAGFADYCLVLARTEPDQPRHRGISAFLVPMDQGGVDIRPIRQINGDHEFAEVFFNRASVPAGGLLGAPGQGWEVAMGALEFERSTNFMRRQVRLALDIEALVKTAQASSEELSASLKTRLADLLVRSECLRFTVWRSVAEIGKSGRPGILANASKVYWSETHQAAAEFALELDQALERPGHSELVTSRSKTVIDYLSSRAATIYAGTSEIQRNIIAERGLGLPR